LQRLGLFIATCGYLGYVPVAPGTFGSAAGLIAFYAVRSTGSPEVELAVIAILFAVGIWSGTVAEHHFGGIDPGPVVMDEVVGMLITLALLPVNAVGAAVGFLVFRVLDVVKPWPSAWL
jgi:phosphatidylglycerophosphatase A